MYCELSDDYKLSLWERILAFFQGRHHLCQSCCRKMQQGLSEKDKQFQEFVRLW